MAYCFNNAVNLIDLNGKDPVPVWALNIVDGTASRADYQQALSANPGAWAGSARTVVDKAVGIAKEYDDYDDYIFLYSEHKKKGTTNKSNRQKHQEGQSRKKRDHRGEKGDKRREDRSNKRHPQYSESDYSLGDRLFAAICVLGGSLAIVYILGNDVTGIGVGDDAALLPLIPFVVDNASKVFG